MDGNYLYCLQEQALIEKLKDCQYGMQCDECAALVEVGPEDKGD